MNNKNLAPIVLFVFNRPWHTLKTLEALSKNKLADHSELFVYCDGPKNNSSEAELVNISEVRQIVQQKKWCEKVNVIISDTNKGLSSSVINGVTEIVNRFGRIIVLEDDLVTSPWFLTFMNEGLEMYSSNQNIYSINGYMFDIDFKTKFDTFLCPWATTSWGWSTWSESWACLTSDLKYKDIIQNNDFLSKRFNLGDYDYCSMLNNNNSWAIKWYYSVFLKNGLGVFPTDTLVQNIGFDGSGVHKDDFLNKIVLRDLDHENLLKNDIKVNIDIEKYSLLLNFFKKKRSYIEEDKSLLKKFINLIKFKYE